MRQHHDEYQKMDEALDARLSRENYPKEPKREVTLCAYL